MVESEKKVEPIEVKDSPSKESALGSANKVLFIFSCIVTGLIVLTLAIPVVLFVIGIISAIFWLLMVVVVSIFTIGMIWLSDEFKAFNGGWMDINDKLFNHGNAIAEAVKDVIPIMAGIGAAIIIANWIILIIAYTKDKAHHKRNIGFTIALGIMTLVYIAIAIVSIMRIEEINNISPDTTSTGLMIL